MPYKSDDELPDSVQNNLPKHAQHIYRQAFNSAYREYKNPKKRRDPNQDREAVAHQVAWAAVKNEYHKQGDKWVASRKQKTASGS